LEGRGRVGRAGVHGRLVGAGLGPAFVFLIHRFHSISFTRAQGIPKYKIGFGKEKDARVGERLV
jgi:hypothetical protein